jgi:uroporphyrinogen decarboxylase
MKRSFLALTSHTSPFLQACFREPTSYTPIWFMRQAGRSLPEFRAIRERHDFMEVCRHPELCAEVTLQPVHRLGVDAAILFADIMTPLIGIGLEIELVEHKGPVIQKPIRSAPDLDRLRPLAPDEDLSYVAGTIRLVKMELGERIPLIGFAGAPFTLAAYLIEGGASRDFTTTKSLMYNHPKLWHRLMNLLADLTAVYLRAQAEWGADAVQLFDSWVGCLSPVDYATYVRPYTQRTLGELGGLGKPVIHFGTNTATLLDQMRDEGATVIGVDWRVDLDVAWKSIGTNLAIQGNLDPSVLLGPWESVQEQANGVLRRAEGRAGHIFNLGHGILPQTPLDNLLRLVEFVHQYSLPSSGV